MGAMLWKKLDWSLGILFAIAMISAISVFGIYDNIYMREYAGPQATAFSNTALYAAFSLISMMSLMALMNLEAANILEDGFATFCVVSSGLVIYQRIIHHTPLGLMGNSSINGTMIALTFPFAAMTGGTGKMWRDLPWAIIPLMAIPMCESSVPVLTLIAVLCAFFATTPHLKSFRYQVTALLITTAFSVTCYFTVPNFSHDSGRYLMWKTIWKFIISEGAQWTGFGLGTFFMWGPGINHKFNVSDGNFWIWAHNDWLQIIFEMGLIGLFFSILVYGRALDKSIKSPYHFASLAGFGVAAFFNFPLHVAIGALLGSYLIFVAFKIGLEHG